MILAGIGITAGRFKPRVVDDPAREMWQLNEVVTTVDTYVYRGTVMLQ